jgi:Domain of unknown function (DUF4263)
VTWSILNEPNPIVSSVIYEWERRLSANLPERDYHSFIKTHANLFLVNPLIYSHFSISKLKLGSELELDFAIPFERHSLGLEWELIEIEKPQDAPYNKDGTPSAALTRATQQIRDWKYWLKNSRSEAQKLFSVWKVRPERTPNFRYKIIIGTRENSEKYIDKRNQYGADNNIEIRSFDYLTDCLKGRFFSDEAHLGNGNWDFENRYLCKKLANPFVESFTDSEWKKILENPEIHRRPHFMSHAADVITSSWNVNQKLVNKFDEFLKALQISK